MKKRLSMLKKPQKNNEKKAVRYHKHGGYVYEAEARECEKCANEHRQLAEWLRELQAYRKEK